jgi:uncharacterized membrane protein
VTTLPSRLTLYLFLVSLALIALLFATIWALSWFHRRFLSDEEENKEEEPPYDITQLRKMCEDGIITSEEFERLKRKIYGRRPYRS